MVIINKAAEVVEGLYEQGEPVSQEYEICKKLRDDEITLLRKLRGNEVEQSECVIQLKAMAAVAQGQSNAAKSHCNNQGRAENRNRWPFIVD